MMVDIEVDRCCGDQAVTDPLAGVDRQAVLVELALADVEGGRIRRCRDRRGQQQSKQKSFADDIGGTAKQCAAA
ncbi:MAG: hypothetical protein JSW31_09895 [Burkholderiales bacterium]|nr:MAG: hypothetical protein JSW31_09895 [Burkholderiales bacterium]